MIFCPNSEQKFESSEVPFNTSGAARYYALVLAAGRSSRAGAFKMELPLAGYSMLHRVLSALAPAVCGAFVVTGHEAPRVEALARAWPPPHDFSVQTVPNPLYSEGMLSSVLAGTRAVPEGSFLFILPGDYPLLTTGVFQNLQTAANLRYSANQETPQVFIPRYREKNGHPVLIAPECLAALRAFAGEQPTGGGRTLKEFLSGRPSAYIDVEDESVLIDLDTPDDLQRIEKLLQNC
jgi:CTP:molybdopterin cytidylyltransferase MocA